MEAACLVQRNPSKERNANGELTRNVSGKSEGFAKRTSVSSSTNTTGMQQRKLAKSKSVAVQSMSRQDGTTFLIGGKPLVCPRSVPLDLLFFRRIFSNLHKRYGNGLGEVPVAVFQRSVVRLFRVLGMHDVEFNAEEYDSDSSGAVGWFEFVTCWKKSKMSVTLSTAERAFLAMEDPGTCFVGSFLSSFLMLLIFINCTCFMMATMPGMKQRKEGCPTCEPEVYDVFEYLEAICVAFFSLEYVLRLFLSPLSRTELLDYEKILEYVTEHEELRIPSSCVRLTRFVLQPMNIIDLFAIAPFYIEIFLGFVVSNLTVLRVLRLTRLFRLVKLGRYFEVLQLVVRVFNKSLQVLGVLLVYLILGVCFSSAIMFFAEGGTWDPVAQDYVRTSHEGERSVSPFKSIPHSFWWCIVTFTTVGYGDAFPVTVMGKFVAVFTMLGGVLVLAMPISAISMNFAEVWASWIEEQRLEAECRMVDVLSVTKALEGLESRSRLVIEVHDFLMGNTESEFLGEVEVSNLPVDKFEVQTKADELLPLQANFDKKPTNRVAGSVMIGWTWTPYPAPDGEHSDSVWGTLEVRVQRAEDLLGSDWKKGGNRDAFVVVQAWPKPPVDVEGEVGSKPECLKTKPVTDTLNPVWNEVLTFDFDWPRDYRPVEAQIFGHDRVAIEDLDHDLASHSPGHSLHALHHGRSFHHGLDGTRSHPLPRRSQTWRGEDSIPHGEASQTSMDYVSILERSPCVEGGLEAQDLTHVRKVAASQGQELRRVAGQVAEMHGVLQRLETLLLPAAPQSGATRSVSFAGASEETQDLPVTSHALRQASAEEEALRPPSELPPVSSSMPAVPGTVS